MADTLHPDDLCLLETVGAIVQAERDPQCLGSAFRLYKVRHSLSQLGLRQQLSTASEPLSLADYARLAASPLPQSQAALNALGEELGVCAKTLQAVYTLAAPQTDHSQE